MLLACVGRCVIVKRFRAGFKLEVTAKFRLVLIFGPRIAIANAPGHRFRVLFPKITAAANCLLLRDVIRCAIGLNDLGH